MVNKDRGQGRFPVAPATWLRAFLVLPLLALGMAVAAIAPVSAQTIDYDLATTSVMRIKLPVSQAVTVVVSAPLPRSSPPIR